MKIDRKMLYDILRQNMLLADSPSLASYLRPVLDKGTSEDSLAQVLAQIRDAIIKKHPVIDTFLCEALKDNLIKDINEEQKEIINRAIHHLFLLEKITKLMIDRPELIESVRKHLLVKRKQLSAASPISMWRTSNSLFVPTKVLSIDAAIDGVIRRRRQTYISFRSQEQYRAGLKLNIAEAVASDMASGYVSNATTGMRLAMNTTGRMSMAPDKSIKFSVSQQWMQAYQSWNLAFITGNLNHLEILYPKLLIPQVIDSNPEDYLFRRTIALWLTVNFYLFAQAKESGDTLVNSQELAHLWGQLNSRYFHFKVRQ